MATGSALPLAAAFEVELPPTPYPGLRPFEAREWPIFFGRERMTDEVINRLIQQHLVVVHGDSGCGKSSLVRAGVLAQLEQERARSDVRWRTGHMLPREAPLQNLARALAELRGAPDDPDCLHQIHRILNHGAEAPAALAEMLCREDQDNVCILFDQFEELFAFAGKGGRAEAQLVVDFLVGLQAKPPPGLYAILTVRSEFLGACARFKGLAEAVNRTQYLLPQMDRLALLRAIREPATLYEGEVSRALAERLIADAGGDQDQLPLIQHGLMLLWRRKVGPPAAPARPGGLAEAPEPWRRDNVLSDAPAPFWHATGPEEPPARLGHEGDESVPPPSYADRAGPTRRLGLEDYRGGSLVALLSEHADEAMADAAPDTRRAKIVEHLFRALTDINAEGNAVRRPQTLAQLVAVTGSDEGTLRNIIDHFRADGVSFLNPYGAAPVAPDTLIDISHEALIRRWRRIADNREGWLQREFRDGLIWKSLRLQAEEGGTLSAVATSIREAWLATLPSESWCERYGAGWGDVQRLMVRSRKARAEEERRRQELEESKRREAAERARQNEEARQAAKLAAKQQELLEAQGRIAAEQLQRAEAERERAAEAEARAREADAGRRRSKRLALIAAGLALVALCAAIAAGSFWFKALHEQARVTAAFESATAERQRAQLAISLFRAEQARNQLTAGFPIIAMQLAIAGLPEDPAHPWAQPWVAETAGALVEALGAQRAQHELRILHGHQGSVRAAKFSPDGARIVSGSDDGTIRVWDARSRAELSVLRGHQDRVRAAEFSPDGARIVSGSDDGTVRVWDVASAAERLVLRGHGNEVWATGFAPDGTRIVSGAADSEIRVWDSVSGKELQVLHGHEGGVAAVGFSPDGARIISGSEDDTARVWDAASGQQLLVLSGHEGSVKAAAFSPDGRRIVTANGLRYFDVSARGKVYIWDAGTGKRSTTFEVATGLILDASFSSDGEAIISGSTDGVARIWNIGTSEPVDVLQGERGSLYAVQFSPDQSQIVAGSADTSILLWDRASDNKRTQILRSHQAGVAAVDFSPDGSRLVGGSSDSTARVWDAASGTELLVLRGHEGEVLAAGFSPDGGRIVSGSFDKSVRVWDAASGAELLVLRRHEGTVWAAGFSPDGARIVSGSNDRTVRVWDAASGAQQLVLRGHEGEVLAVDFSPDGGRIVSGSFDNSVRVWDAASGAELLVLRGHEGHVQAAGFSPDGAHIVSGSDDGTVRVWSAASGTELLVLRGHKLQVFAAGFSPDGARIVSGSADGTVRVWDAASGAELLVLRGHTDAVFAADASPDGARIVSSSADSTVRVTWIGRSRQELIETARARLPRELTEEEKRRFYLITD